MNLGGLNIKSLWIKCEILLDYKLIHFYTKYDLPNDRKIILFPGRLTNWKGQFEFLNIIQSLDKNKNNVSPYWQCVNSTFANILDCNKK